MKKCVSVFFILLCGIGLYAQFPPLDATDLVQSNLKGPVVQLTEYFCTIKYAFGEPTVKEKKLSHMEIYNDSGNLLLSSGENSKNKFEWFNIYSYNDNQQLVYRHGYKLASEIGNYEYDGIESNRIKDNQDLFQKIIFSLIDSKSHTDTTEYHPDGRKKCVNFSDGGKIIYKYNDNGYETKSYKRDGTETSAIYMVLKKERQVLSGDQKGYISVRQYNEKGELQSKLFYLAAANGNMLSGSYYKRNKHGDMIALSSSENVNKSIKGLEDFSNIISENINLSGVDFFEYEYDDMGNWVVKRQFNIKNGEKTITGMWTRTITYAQGNNNGQLILQELIDKADAERKRLEEEEQARKMWEALPEYAQPAESFLNYVKSTIVYPSPKSELGKLLKQKESYLCVDIRLSIYEDGRFAIPELQTMYIPEIRKQEGLIYLGQIYYGAGVPCKDHVKWMMGGIATWSKTFNNAISEIDSIIASIIRSIGNAPKGNPGKKSGSTYFRIEFGSGICLVRNMEGHYFN